MDKCLLFLGIACSQLAAVAHAAYGDPEVLKQIASRPSKCASGCTRYGTCNEQLGRCDCPRHLTGATCQEELLDDQLKIRCSSLGYNSVDTCRRGHNTCLNNCNLRGACERGFCRCEPGHFGADCSLSLDDQGRTQILQGTGYTTRSKKPWIYSYDLPPEFNTWVYLSRNVDRPTFFYFWQRLLGAGAITADPSKADYFFIPVYMRHPTDNTKLLVRALDYIKSTWPFYTRSQRGSQRGSHFVIHVGDWGKMEAWWRLKEEVKNNLTWLTHWGLHNNTKKRHWQVAHDPSQDVVIPVITPHTRLAVFGHDKSILHPRAKNIPPKDKIFFHAGRICGDNHPPDPNTPWPYNCQEAKRYSGGVRQRECIYRNRPWNCLQIYYHHHNRTGYHITNHIPKYAQQLRTSKFCLSTQGGGHGNRQVIGALAGCVLVSIGDGIYEPFEPELNYSKFGLKLREDDIPLLHEKIASVTEEEYTRKQVALKCAAQHLHWASMVGGMMAESGKYDAFETALEVLRARKDHPDVPPERLTQVDPELRRFMACGADDFGLEPPPEPNSAKLCSNSALDTNRCTPCLRLYPNTFGPPGGALCCGHLDLAQCPRNWQ